MAATAALRASFKYDVTVTCWNTGAALNSGYCMPVLVKRERDDLVGDKVGLAMLAAVAGLSASELYVLANSSHPFQSRVDLEMLTTALVFCSVSLSFGCSALTGPSIRRWLQLLDVPSCWMGLERKLVLVQSHGSGRCLYRVSRAGLFD
jgi:hypothetical protein